MSEQTDQPWRVDWDAAPQPSFFRRHRTKLLLAASAAVIIGVAGTASVSSSSVSPGQLRGRCINVTTATHRVWDQVSCSGPHEFKVVAVVGDRTKCPANSFATVSFQKTMSDPVRFLCGDPHA